MSETKKQLKLNQTPLSNVFSIFCGTDKLHPVMLKPFVVGNKTYATDAFTMVICDNENIDFEFENNETRLNVKERLKVKEVIPKINAYEIINLDTVNWDLLMTEDETTRYGDDVECGHCFATGFCEGDIKYKGKVYTFEYECPVCEGTGFEAWSKEVKTGNKTFRHDDMIEFKGSFFSARKFYKLKKVKDILAVNEVKLISYRIEKDKLLPVMFRVGIVEILLMPCASASGNVVAKFH